MWALRNAGSDFPEKASYALLYEPLIRKYSKTDFDMLINAQDLRQISASLDDSYKTTVEKAANGGKADYLTVENEMWKAYYLELSQYIKKHCKKTMCKHFSAAASTFTISCVSSDFAAISTILSMR